MSQMNVRPCSSFRFLDLPAELRSMVYTILRESVPTRLIHRADRAHYAARSTHLSFAFTNRQLRYEFLDVFALKLDVRVQLHDAALYVRVFLRDVKRAAGRLQLDISHAQIGDVYPLLAMAKKHPNLKVKVIYPIVHLLGSYPPNDVFYSRIFPHAAAQLAKLQGVFNNLIAPPAIYKERK
jgi:hypothetical protein